jgi:hypothetical protein
MHEAHFRELGAALRRSRIHCRPALVSGLGSDVRVQFSRVKFPANAIEFPYEDALRTVISKAIGSYGPLEPLRLIKQEYRLSTGRRLDLLCKVAHGEGRGDLVIVELKPRVDQRTAEQVVTYLEDLRREDIARGRGVRAIVITGKDDPAGVRLIQTNGLRVDWYQYEVGLRSLSQESAAASVENRKL